MSIETLSIREKNALVQRLRKPLATPPRRNGESSADTNLSRGQQQIWLSSKIDPDLPLWSLPTFCHILAPVDVGLFRSCVRALAQSREIFRMRVSESTGAPMIERADAATLELEFIDLSAQPDPRRNLDEWVERRKRRPLDPSVSLFDTALIKLGEAHYVWFLNVHHLVADGWSVWLLAEDIAEAYAQGVSKGPEGIELGARPGFADPAGQGPLRAKRPKDADNVAYWRRVVQEEYDATTFYRSEQRAYSHAGAVRRVSRTLPREVVQRVRQWIDERSRACEARFSLFDAALSALAAYLLRLGCHDRISVGVPIHNRTDRSTREIIGPLAEVYPVRLSLSREDDAESVLRRCRSALKEAYAHTPCSFERAANDRIYDCELNYLLYKTVLFEGVPMRLETVHCGYSAHPLVLQLIEHRSTGDFTLNLDCRVDCFDEVQQLETLEHLARTVRALLETPKAPIGAYALLGPAQWTQICAWNDTERMSEKFRPVTDDLEAWSKAQPERIALQTEDEAVSYAELWRRSDAAAGMMRREGVAPNEIVGVCLERSVEMIVAIVAILKIGATYVPLDPGLPPDRLRHMMEDAGLRVILSAETSRETVAPIAPTHIKILNAPWSGGDVAEAAEIAGPQQGAYLIYTSGSTGQPKGVLVEHLGLFNRLDWMKRRYALGSEDCFLQKTPFSFDVSVWEILLPLVCGARMAIAKPGGHRDPKYIADMIERFGVTTLHFVPPMLREFLTSNENRTFSTITKVFCSGDALTPEVASQFYNAFDSSVQLHNLYGPTEASIDVTAWECAPRDQTEAIPIGMPIDNICTYILDESLNPVPIGIAGELYLAGVGLARGYLNKPALTAASFLPNPFKAGGSRLYRTGDLVRYRPNGDVEFLGRRDHQVKVRGNRIELPEIEGALSAHPSVGQAVVIAIRDGNNDQSICAFIVGSGDENASAATLNAHLRRRLPEYMLPQHYRFVAHIPCTHNGKIDRRALLALSGPRETSQETAQPPRTETERFLCNEWEQALNRWPIGVTDNFFDIGGHSLLVNTLFMRIQDRYGPTVSFAELFQLPTIAELASLIDERANGEALDKAPQLYAVPRSQPIPFSLTQERFWYLSQFEKGQALYNMTSAFRVSGRLNIDALREAVRYVERKHEILRSNYAMEDGRPQVTIDPEPRAELKVMTSIGGEGGPLEKNIARKVARDFALRPFNLATDPLFRCAILEMIGGDSLLVVVTHHIVVDGFSMMLLFRDLVFAYNSLVRGDRLEKVEPQRLQYADFAHWQLRWMNSGEATSEREHWKKALANVEVAELPRDRPRPPAQSFSGAALEFTIPEAHVRALQELADRSNGSLFTVFVAALSILLSKYSGKRDVTIGTVVSGRNSNLLNSLVGPLVNTLVIRSVWDGGASVQKVVDLVKRRLLDALANQTLPFEKVIESCGARPDSARTSLFQTMLVYQDIEDVAAQLEGVTTQFVPPEERIALFDMTFQIFPGDGEFTGNIIYRTELFSEAGARRIMVSWLKVLELLGASSERSVDSLEIFEAPARLPTVDGVAMRQSWAQRGDVVAAFRAAAARNPQKVAVTHGARSLTYGSLDENSDRLAAHLAVNLSVRQGDRVAICCDRSVDFVVAMLAVLKTGAAYVPIDPTLPAGRINHIVSDSQSLAMIAESRHVDGFDREGPGIVLLDRLDLATITDAAPALRLRPDDLCYVVYTSGSTGYPKGVMVSHGGLVNLIDWFHQGFDITEEDVATQVLSASFDGFVIESWPYLTRGASVHMMDRETLLDREKFRDYLSENRVSVAFLPSALVSSYMALPWPQPCFLRCVLAGGDRLVISGDIRTDIALFNLYGPTEATVVATSGRVEPGDRTPPIGFPVANAEILILDDDMKRTPAGAVGEIYIGGVGVARGYIGKSQLTAASFVPHPFGYAPGARLYKTGDLARYADDGAIVFVSRRDDQVSINGYRVEVQEIENRIAMLPEVRQVFVFCHSSEAQQPHLVGFYSCHEERIISPGSVIAFVEEFLPEYMIPRRLLCLQELPLTRNGKFDTAKLLEHLSQAASNSESYRSPATEQERILAAIWEETLNVEGIGVDDDFYSLGGTSISLIVLHNKMKKHAGESLPLVGLLRATTIRQQAALWLSSDTRRHNGHAPLVLLANEGGDGSPIVLAHPPGGEVSCYRELASLISAGREIWAIQDVRQYEPEIVAVPLDQWLDDYASAVANHFSKPIVLAGWSGGGLICCALANRLRAAGRVVESIILLDTRFPTGDADEQTLELQIHRGVLFGLAALVKQDVALLSADQIASMSEAERVAHLAGQLRRIGLLSDDDASAPAQRLIALMREHVAAMHQLPRSPVEGPLVRLLTNEQIDGQVVEDAQQEIWRNLVRGQYREVMVAGNHLSMLQRPNVDEVARVILTALGVGEALAPASDDSPGAASARS